uniref:Carboxypeptidase n=1 Tax=Noctiluca scintillans TaxID=2966 RepID=A0A7S1FH13_NOCSC
MAQDCSTRLGLPGILVTQMKTVVALSILAACAADKTEDLVTSLPGFTDTTWPFKVYSGFLDVPGPVASYDALKIHYQFHTSQGSPSTDPMVTWHQGGPGSSSITVGLYGEMGVFVIGENGNYLNPNAWNKQANMLYLESPAGSGGTHGYSECIKNSTVVPCHWTDVTQAVAYANTLQAFFLAFPEFAQNDLYLTGESYFGQYGPNIAHYIVNTEPFKSNFKLKGLALGNACWGGNESCVACNGPSEDKIDVDLFFGKGLYSPKLHIQIQMECDFPSELDTCEGDEVPGHAALSDACKTLLDEMYRQVGPMDIYNIYNNCPATAWMLQRIGKDRRWLSSFLRRGMHNPTATRQALIELNGGYQWDCLGDAAAWITQADVRKALHLDTVMPGTWDMTYDLSGPASVTLYPELVKKLHVLIYNGDADACVPYNGNEQWIGELEGRGILQETKAWAPWVVANASTPAGYITEYSVPGASTSFHFATVRLAGHMVPQFQPAAASELLRMFLHGTARTEVV